MKKILFIILLLGVAGYGYTIYTKDNSRQIEAVVESAPDFPLEEQNAELTNTYTHPAYRFSFRYPDGYTVNTTANEGGELLVVQNEKGNGFQMQMQKIDEDVDTITVEMIRRDIPDIEISDPQDLLIGDNGKGVAFLSNDPLFDGKSREIWFAHNRVFYQITTYAKYDTLMKNIFATWEFR